MLDFSKIESGAYQWAHESLDLVNAVNEAMAATSQLAYKKNISVGMEVPGTPVLIDGDKDRLVQVVINLLSNAIKYSRPDTGTVRLKLSSDKNEARLEVLDNGPGIVPSEQERIFEKFHQLRDASEGNPQGTGLGLAICKMIVENHGGRIWVESQFGSGARFIVTLPLKKYAPVV